MKKRRIAMIMTALFLLGSASMAAAAAETPSATQKNLRSQGAIRYQDGAETVVIDSADLYMLADSLDLFKVRVTEQLGILNTYLSQDSGGVSLTGTRGVYVTHQKPAASQELNPTALSFDTILEGIAASQTIPTDPTAYGMASGTKLYREKNGKLQIGPKEGEGITGVDIHKATAEELSAGAAAWVDGKLILGTGEANRSFHESGAASGSGTSGAGSGSSGPGTSEPGSSGTGGSGDLTPIFADFNTVGGYYKDFNGEIPYTFTPGKAVLLLSDGPLKVTFDGANMPDSAINGRWCSLYYWKSNKNAKIKVKVGTSTAGYSNQILLKEW